MEDPLSKYQRVPIAEIMAPKPGRIVYQESYWIVTPEREVLFFHKGHNSPQCNTNKEIVESWLPRFPGCTMEYMPMFYLEHNCYDYVF